MQEIDNVRSAVVVIDRQEVDPPLDVINCTRLATGNIKLLDFRVLDAITVVVSEVGNQTREGCGPAGGINSESSRHMRV